MRRGLGLTVLMLLVAAGCRTAGDSPMLTDLRGGPDNDAEIQSVSHQQPAVDRPVELEPEPVDEQSSSWRRLLNPFAPRRKRIPLPLSPKTPEAGADESADEF